MGPDALLKLLARFQAEGLLNTKTDDRDKDRIDRQTLERLRQQL